MVLYPVPPSGAHSQALFREITKIFPSLSLSDCLMVFESITIEPDVELLFVSTTVGFTVADFTLPSSLAFSTNTAVTTQVPQISKSAAAATALVENLVMQAVTDVLEENGRNALLPSFVISAILEQLTITVNYMPLECAIVYTVGTAPGMNSPFMMGQNNCFILNDLVTALCTTMNTCAVSPTATMVSPIPEGNRRITGSVMTTNFIMAGWSTQMWQSIFNRVLQSLRRGPFGTNFAAASVVVM